VAAKKWGWFMEGGVDFRGGLPVQGEKRKVFLGGSTLEALLALRGAPGLVPPIGRGGILTFEGVHYAGRLYGAFLKKKAVCKRETCIRSFNWGFDYAIQERSLGREGKKRPAWPEGTICVREG